MTGITPYHKTGLFLFWLFLLCYSPQLLAQTSFLAQLQPFCGKQYAGTVVFPQGDTDPFNGKALAIDFISCEPQEVRIALRVGEDRSRTWVISHNSQGLLLKHDHRHADGTPDTITQYGGYATTPDTATVQQFPADAYTAKLIPAAATNEWTLSLSKDKLTLSYSLKRDGALRFHADFDLSKPLP